MQVEAGANGRGEWRSHGTVVLAAMLGTTLPIVHLYSTGVMLPSLETEFGWSRAEISSGPAIVSVVVVLLAPFLGVAIDRFGPRRIGLAGATLFCLSLALFATATASLWHWWALWGLLALAAAAVNPAIWTSGVTSLFFRTRGLALAVTLTGTGLGAILVPNIASLFVAELGWRQAYLGLAVIWALAVLPPITLFFWSSADRRRTGRDAVGGQVPAIVEVPAGTVRAAMLSPRFLKLALAAAGITLVSNGIVLNMVPILRTHAMSTGTAAGIASFAGLGSILGRLGGGYLLDRINANLVGAGAATILVIAMLTLFAFPQVSPAVSAAVLLLGLSVGVEYDAVAYLAGRHFSLAMFGTLFGTITGLLALTGGLGPLFANMIYDRFGSYDPALWLFAPLGVGAAILFLTLGPYPDAENMLGD